MQVSGFRFQDARVNVRIFVPAFPPRLDRSPDSLHFKPCLDPCADPRRQEFLPDGQAATMIQKSYKRKSGGDSASSIKEVFVEDSFAGFLERKANASDEQTAKHRRI